MVFGGSFVDLRAALFDLFHKSLFDEFGDDHNDACGVESAFAFDVGESERIGACVSAGESEDGIKVLASGSCGVNEVFLNASVIGAKQEDALRREAITASTSNFLIVGGN